MLNNPKGWVLALNYLLTIIFAIGSMIVSISGDFESASPIVYVLFAAAAITLAYSVYTIVKFAPNIKNRLTSFLKKYEFTKHILEHYGFRTVVFATTAMSLNIIYVIFNGVVAIVSNSVWYGALAGYYIIITLLRSSIISYHKKKRSIGNNASVHEESTDQELEIKKYKRCGIYLLILPVCLSAAITEMVVNNSAFVHWGWTVFAFAAYTFYKITMAILNVIKAHKSSDITLQALRNIGLADALVSILALQTSLLFAFSDGSGSGFANALTGAAVCVATVIMGIIMIIKSNKLMKRGK